MALQQIYQATQRQAASLSYFDLFWLFSMAAFCIAPFVCVMRRSVAGQGTIVGH
jgi:hypothetical protein